MNYLSRVIESCLVCGSTDLKAMRNYEKDYLVRCRKCSFVFSNIRPTERELEQVYQQYKRGQNPKTVASIEKLRERAKWLNSLNSINNVIDVGCGDGDFLARFVEMGCVAFGTEFDKESQKVSQSKGAIMLGGGLNPELPEMLSGFDLIIFTEVIEHINNPIEVLQNFKKIMKPGALLFITTPNFESIERHILGPRWGMIMYPEHITYYSPKTLDRVLQAQGFTKVEIYTENISIYRILQYINRVSRNRKTQFNAELISAQAQAIVTGNRILKSIKLAINSILKITNSGSSIVAVYKKPD